MTAPAYTTDLTTYNDCTANTGWGELVGMALGAGPDIDTDLAIHGSVCISQDRAKTGLNSQVFSGTAPTWTSGWGWFIWHKFFAPNSLATLANGGARVMVGTDLSNYEGWYMDGSDSYPYGGWKNYVVDPETTPDQTSGTVTAYNTLGNGWLLITAPAKGNPFNTDIIRYGRGKSIFTGGEAANYATFAGYALVNDNPTTGRFGLLQKIDGGYLFKGLMSLGTAAALVDMRVSNVAITIDNTTKVASGFNRIEITHASSNVEWTNISFTALGTVSKGQFEMIGNATHIDIGGTYTGLDTFIYQSNADITGRTFRGCGQVTQGGATFTTCTFDKSLAAVSLLADSLADVTKCTFNSDGSNHAVNLGTIVTTQSMTWDNFANDYAATNGSTGNETILVSVDTGITLTINVSDGADTPTYYNTGAGTVNVVAGQKTFKFTLNPSVTSYEWRLYSVTAAGSLDGSVELDGEEVATADNQTYTYSYSADTPIAVQIMHGDYVYSVTFYELLNENQSKTILLTPETND